MKEAVSYSSVLHLLQFTESSAYIQRNHVQKCYRNFLFYFFAYIKLFLFLSNVVHFIAFFFSPHSCHSREKIASTRIKLNFIERLLRISPRE